MSFGDGDARVVSINVKTVDIPIADGSANVYPVYSDDIYNYITPIKDNISLFNIKMDVYNAINDNAIIADECTMNIQNNTRPDIKIPYDINTSLNVKDGIGVFFSSTIQVIDPNDSQNYLLNYLQSNFLPTKIEIFTENKKIFNKSDGYANVYNTKRKDPIEYMIEDIDPISIKSYDKFTDSSLIYNDCIIMVENVSQNSQFIGGITIQPILIPVEDYKPPTIGATASGGNLKGFKIEIQKYSYFEQNLSFFDKSVKDITGLPDGMVFENGYLKGSPLLSGKYIIAIKMDDNSAVNGLIVVTQVPRNL